MTKFDREGMLVILFNMAKSFAAGAIMSVALCASLFAGTAFAEENSITVQVGQQDTLEAIADNTVSSKSDNGSASDAADSQNEFSKSGEDNGLAHQYDSLVCPDGENVDEACNVDSKAEDDSASGNLAGSISMGAVDEAIASQDKPAETLPEGFLTDQILENEAVYKIATAYDKVLDVYDASDDNGANVEQFHSNNTLAQYFIAYWLGDGWYKFANIKSNKVLDVYNASSEVGANAQQFEWNGSFAQQWGLIPNSDSTYALVARCALANRLDVQGGFANDLTNLRLWSANGTKAQNFTFIKNEPLSEAVQSKKSVTVDDGCYTISIENGENKVVDVANAGVTDCTNVQSFDYNGTMAQKVIASSLGNGLYKITFVVSNKVLDVFDAGIADGTNVQQYSWNGTLAQIWYLLPVVGSDYLTIHSANSGKVLDVYNAGEQNGANIQLFSWNGTSAQAFKFVRTQLVSNGTYVIQSSVMAPMVLDVSGGSVDDGANVQTWRSNGTDAQKWIFTYLGDGIYSIQSLKSGKYLDVARGSLDDLANIQQFTGNGTDAQKWFIAYNEGAFSFKSVLSGKYIDVYNASRFSG